MTGSLGKFSTRRCIQDASSEWEEALAESLRYFFNPPHIGISSVPDPVLMRFLESFKLEIPLSSLRKLSDVL